MTEFSFDITYGFIFVVYIYYLQHRLEKVWSEFWQARLTVCAIVCRHSDEKYVDVGGHEANDLVLLRNLPSKTVVARLTCCV